MEICFNVETKGETCLTGKERVDSDTVGSFLSSDRVFVGLRILKPSVQERVWLL